MTEKEYYIALEAAGHLLKRTDDGAIDNFALESVITMAPRANYVMMYGVNIV